VVSEGSRRGSGKAAELRQRVPKERRLWTRGSGPCRTPSTTRLSTPGVGAGPLGAIRRWLEQSKDVPLAASSWALQMKELAPAIGRSHSSGRLRKGSVHQCFWIGDLELLADSDLFNTRRLVARMTGTRAGLRAAN